MSEEKSKKMSLLKPYTNRDRLNDMSSQEFAKFLLEVDAQDFMVDICCEICCEGYCEYYSKEGGSCEGNCENAIVKWLESEATE